MQNQVYSKAMRINNDPSDIPNPFQSKGNRVFKRGTFLSFFFAISKNFVNLISPYPNPKGKKAVNYLVFKSESSTFT
ncbi:MAG: hypothetical protein CMI25_00300 [Opitutae bacterium]|nr:hypothetical protein [Opitutae bacterium]